MSKIYNNNGYLNIDAIYNNGMVYNFVCGGRGTGKTFGCLKYVIDHHLKFIFLRRTQTQVDLIKSDDLNPFRALESVLGPEYCFCMKKINKNINGVYHGEFNAEKQMNEPCGPVLGYIMALSTVSNIRGFDASDVSVLIYDEFIGEKHERPIQAEGTAFLNAIETIARNRELQDKDPLKVICLSNSNDLVNPLFIELQLVNKVEKMLSKGQESVLYPDRDLAIYLLKQSPISSKKAQTSLYKLVGKESDFMKMSIGNEFAAEQRDLIQSKSLKEYKPVVIVGELCIYKHKSERKYYITDHISGDPERYDSSDMDLKRFTRDYYYLWLAYLNRRITFESYIDQVIFEKYFNIRK